MHMCWKKYTSTALKIKLICTFCTCREHDVNHVIVTRGFDGDFLNSIVLETQYDDNKLISRQGLSCNVATIES